MQNSVLKLIAYCNSITQKLNTVNTFYLGYAQERGIQLSSGFSQPEDPSDSSKAGFRNIFKNVILNL